MYQRNSFNQRLLAAKVETCFLFCLVIAMSKPIPSSSPLRLFFPTVVGSSPPVHPLLLLPSSPYYTPGTSPLPSNKYDRFFSPPSLLFIREAASRVRRHKKGGMKKEGSVFPALSLSPLGQPLVLSEDPLYFAFYTEIAKKT